MNSIDNLIKTICIILNIDPLDGSYVDALGEYFNVIDQPEKPYNREVLVAALVNGVAPGTSEVLIFDSFADFPATGDDNTLYVTKDANIIYRWDTTLLSYQILNDPNIVNPDAPEEGATYYVRLATSSTLNACTYDNGTAGVGATLTGNVNGILSQSNQTGRIDATVPALGNVILVKNQSAALQNGIYEVTQLGSGSQPFVLTRIDGYNETDEIYPSIVFVSAGSSNINRYFTQSTANPTIGVSSLVYGVSTVSFPASTIVFADTYTNSTVEFPGAFTYTNGTLYPTSPGYGATIRANANGALGTINGVTMTSGRRILINDASTPLLNGDYTVTNAGSATQRWQLTRINYQSGGFLNTVREWYVSNPLSDYFGSRWACSQQTINTSQVGISQAINFSQQNITGLKDSPNSIQIDGSTLGIADISINSTNNFAVSVDDSTTNCYLDITPVRVDIVGTDLNLESSNTVGLGVYNGLDESEFQVEVGAINARVSDGTNESNTNINATGINLATLNTNTPSNDNYIDITGGQITIQYFDTFQNKISIYDNLEISTDNGAQSISMDPLNKTITIIDDDGGFINSSITFGSNTNATINLTTTNGIGTSTIGLSDDIITLAASSQIILNTQEVLINSTDLVSISAANNIDIVSLSAGIIIQSDADELLLQGELTTTLRSNTEAVNIESGVGNSIKVDSVNNEVTLNSTGLISTTSLDATIINADAGIYINGNNSNVKLDASGGGRIVIISESDNIILRGTSGNFVGNGLPVYANDGDADADANLQPGALYKVTGNRTVFQKP